MILNLWLELPLPPIQLYNECRLCVRYIAPKFCSAARLNSDDRQARFLQPNLKSKACRPPRSLWGSYHRLALGHGVAFSQLTHPESSLQKSPRCKKPRDSLQAKIMANSHVTIRKQRILGQEKGEKNIPFKGWFC